MRPAFLAVSAVALFSIGTAFSLQAIRPPAPTEPAVPEAVAAAPPGAVNSEVDERSVKAAAVPASDATAPPVVRVKTVRIEPERPAAAAKQQASTAAEVTQQEPATGGDQSAISPAAEKPNALQAPTPEAESMGAAPAPRVRTARAKPPVVIAKRTSHRKRKQDQFASDDVAKDPLSYAPKEPGPESLNPLGKLLSGTR
jgi:hypothetical protein